MTTTEHVPHGGNRAAPEPVRRHATCVRPRCGRPIVAPMHFGEVRDRDDWTHLAPNGRTNRTCKSAAYDDPKPGDDRHEEWLHWGKPDYHSAYPGREGTYRYTDELPRSLSPEEMAGQIVSLLHLLPDGLYASQSDVLNKRYVEMGMCSGQRFRFVVEEIAADEEEENA